MLATANAATQDLARQGLTEQLIRLGLKIEKTVEAATVVAELERVTEAQPAASRLAGIDPEKQLVTFGAHFFFVQATIQQDLKDLAPSAALTIMLMLAIWLFNQSGPEDN